LAKVGTDDGDVDATDDETDDVRRCRGRPTGMTPVEARSRVATGVSAGDVDSVGRAKLRSLAVIVIPSPSMADVRGRGLAPLTAPLMSLSRTLVEPIDGVGGADMDDPDDSEAPAPAVAGPLSEENEAVLDVEVLSEAPPPAVPGRSPDLLLDIEAEEK
jgi:hypothetical protein